MRAELGTQQQRPQRPELQQPKRHRLSLKYLRGQTHLQPLTHTLLSHFSEQALALNQVLARLETQTTTSH